MGTAATSWSGAMRATAKVVKMVMNFIVISVKVVLVKQRWLTKQMA